MKKKLLSILLAALMVLLTVAILPITVAADNYTYTVEFPEGPEQVYIVGDATDWALVAMTMTSATTATYTSATEFSSYRYYADLDWECEEVHADDSSRSNRTACENPDKVEKFKNIPLPATYSVTNGTPDSAKETNHGCITIDKETAAGGETVTVTANPAKGYKLKSLSYVHELSDWSVIGDFTDWFTGDVPMAEIETDVFVSPVLTLSEGALFKVRKNGDWTENFGAEDTTDPYTVAVDTPVAVSQDGRNMAIPSAGNYIVTLNLNDTTITVTSASTSVANPVAITADTNGNYTIKMPAYPVTVTAVFEKSLTVSDILPSDFPTQEAKAWQKSGEYFIRLVTNVQSQTFLRLYDKESGYEIPVETAVTPSGDDFVATYFNTFLGEDLLTLTFHREDGVLVSITSQHINDYAERFNGEYVAPAHTHGAGAKQNGQPATEDAAGYNDYYKCDCGIFFEDEACTEKIGDETALAAWKTGDGARSKLVHTVTPVSEQTATQTEAGFKAYYECVNCSKYYEDAEGATEITDLSAWKAKGGNGYIPSGDEIDAAKTAAKAALDAENAKDPLIDETALTNGKSAIDSASTLADIENAKNNAITAIGEAQATELAAAKTAAKAALDAEEAKDPLNDKASLTAGKSNIDSAATKAAIQSAQTNAIEAIKTAQEAQAAQNNPEPGDEGASLWWLWVLIAVVIVGGVCVYFFVFKKKKNQ